MQLLYLLELGLQVPLIDKISRPVYSKYLFLNGNTYKYNLDSVSFIFQDFHKCNKNHKHVRRRDVHKPQNITRNTKFFRSSAITVLE